MSRVPPKGTLRDHDEASGPPDASLTSSGEWPTEAQRTPPCTLVSNRNAGCPCKGSGRGGGWGALGNGRADDLEGR